MKFTVAIISLLSISSTWEVLAKRVDETKDKREAPSGYSSPGHSSHSYQAPSLGHGDASAISVGAGYSIGGAKPSFSYGGQGSAGGLQFSPEGLPSSGHATLQLPAITLQPGHGIAGNDLSQIMSQLSHSLNSGALTLQPSNNIAEFHEGGQGGQDLSQFSYGNPNLQQYAQAGLLTSAPSYALGNKGLSSYGSTGPVLFNPSESQSNQAGLTYATPTSGHSLGDAGSISLGGSGHSLAGLSLGGSGHSLGGSAHSLGGSGYSLGGSGHSLGGSGQSLGGSAHSLGGSGYSLGGSGHSLGGSGQSLGGALGGYYKSLGGSYAAPGKTSFKPSTYLGSSVQSDSGHGLSGSHGAPSFGGFSSGNHGALSLGSGAQGAGHGLGGSYGSFGTGATKFIAPAHTKSEGFGSSLEGAAPFSSTGHLGSPPGTTYGFPTASYPGNSIHAASSTSPQYYGSPSKYTSSSSFGEGSSSFRGPVSGHSSLSSYNSGPKYSFGGSSGSRYNAPKDSHGAYSESTYNTIKYSEELKPWAQ